MNKNFNKIRVSETRLMHQQMLISTNLNKMTQKKLKIQRKEKFLEVKLFQEHIFTNFIFQLDQLKKESKLDANFDIVFNLLNDKEFCLKNKCYSHPVFSSDTEGNIQILIQVVPNISQPPCTSHVQSYQTTTPIKR